MKAHCYSISLTLTCVALLNQAITVPLPAQTTTPDVKTLSAGPFSLKAPPQWADSILVEKVPANPLYSAAAWKSFNEDSRYTLKPCYANRPQHWAIRFPKLVLKGEIFDKQNAGDDPMAPQIFIHQTDGWSSILENGAFDTKQAATTRTQLRESLTAFEGGLPNRLTPAFVDGGLNFISLKKKLQFKGGHGYRFITQWAIEPDLARRGGLHYLFVGLSDDDSCQIIATFPVDAPGLPSSTAEEEHLGYSAQRYEELSKNFPDYHAAAVAWLEKHEKDFTPSLDALDQLIKSLSAETW